MRIIDWSSDVCSSDLRKGEVAHCHPIFSTHVASFAPLPYAHYHAERSDNLERELQPSGWVGPALLSLVLAGNVFSDRRPCTGSGPPRFLASQVRLRRLQRRCTACGEWLAVQGLLQTETD